LCLGYRCEHVLAEPLHLQPVRMGRGRNGSGGGCLRRRYRVGLLFTAASIRSCSAQLELALVQSSLRGCKSLLQVMCTLAIFSRLLGHGNECAQLIHTDCNGRLAHLRLLQPCLLNRTRVTRGMRSID
jgi:hypothetical protein